MKKNIRAILIAGIIMLAGTGCIQSPISLQTDSPQYAVICVLANNVANNRLYLTRVASLAESITPVASALVRISWQNRSVILVPDSLGRFRDTLVYVDQKSEIQVIPGEMYRLFIRTPDGHEITGRTRVPGEVRITQPQTGATLFTDQRELDLTVVWQPATHCSGYLLEFRLPPFEFWQGNWRKPAPSTFAFFDSTWWHSSVMVPPRRQGLYQVTVAAFEENYFNHTFKGANSAGLDNAVGVFGAMSAHGIAFDVGYFRSQPVYVLSAGTAK